MGVSEKILDHAGVTTDYAAVTEFKPVGLRSSTKQSQVPDICLDRPPKPIAGSRSLLRRRLDDKNLDRRTRDAESDAVAWLQGN
jgi:hypothetical protein